MMYIIDLFDPWVVFGAAFLAYSAGWVWYSKILFQKRWMESIGRTPEAAPRDSREFMGIVIYGFLATLATTLGIKTILIVAAPQTFMVALTLMILITLAFSVTTKFTEMLHESKEPHWTRKPQQLFLIGSGYQIFATFVITSVLWYYA